MSHIAGYKSQAAGLKSQAPNHKAKLFALCNLRFAFHESLLPHALFFLFHRPSSQSRYFSGTVVHRFLTLFTNDYSLFLSLSHISKKLKN
jgi:hypothetical protein